LGEKGEEFAKSKYEKENKPKEAHQSPKKQKPKERR
jgi:hypothetical protein